MVTKKQLANLTRKGKGKPKGATSSHTISDLVSEIKKLEATVKSKTGKSFSLIQNILQRTIKSDVLAGKILDRLYPIPKTEVAVNVDATHTVIEKLPETSQLIEIARTLERTGVFNLLRTNGNNNRIPGTN